MRLTFPRPGTIQPLALVPTLAAIINILLTRPVVTSGAAIFSYLPTFYVITHEFGNTGATLERSPDYSIEQTMSQVNRFKWVRPRYTTAGTYGPGFYQYGLYKMRQLPAQFFNGTIFAPPFTYADIIVPKGSWGLNKALIIRYAWQLLWNGTPPPGGMTLNELVQPSSYPAVLVPGASGPPATVPIQSAIGERILIRLNNAIWGADFPDALAGGRFWDNGGTQLIIAIATSIPDTWWATEEHILLKVSDSRDSGVFSLNFLWIEAFLEQGTNLGALT
jgi:hypothetical protein